MSTYKEMFSSWSSQYLLQKRALGDELSDEAHKAIEEIFKERGEELPPRPTQPIFIKKDQQGKRKSNWISRKISLLFWLFIIGVLPQVFKDIIPKSVGVLIVICFLFYLTVTWLRTQLISREKRESERQQKIIENEDLTDLMIASAEGDQIRVTELLAYGADVNARSFSGSTALIYASLNNQLAIVNTLINAGADINAASHKGNTAHSVAKKMGYEEIVKVLESHSPS